MTITLTVSGRIATVDATTHVVAGNTYPVALSLDSEWTGSLYLRVRFGSLYYDIPFASSAASVDVQMPVGYPEVGIGVFSEALEICTSEARVRLLRSILEAGEQVVEFDSDLYDQWAGEVTALLTDDAFDAESTRPVQNAVLTAWKNTVPLDANLVHKTGNETIAGIKTFSSGIKSAGGGYNRIFAGSTVAYGTGNAKSYFVMSAPGPNSDDINYGSVGLYQSYTGTGARNSIVFQCKSLDGATTVKAELHNRSDGTTRMLVPSHLPVDGNGNHLSPESQECINSDMLAVDPRIVHTTGTETIAGAKTFTSLLTASNVTVKDASTPTITMLKGSDEVANLASDGTQAGLTASSQFFGLRGLGTAPFGQAPSYTADNSADGKIVTRSMLAQSPTVVHTTGNETIAGNKTLSGTTTSNGNMRVNGTFSILPAFIAGSTGWIRLYEVTPHHNSGVIRFTADSAVSMVHPSEIAMYIAGSADSMSMTAYNNEFGVDLIAVRRASDKHVEIWGRKSWSSWQCVFRYRHTVVVGDLTESATAPAVGDTYDMIATL